MKGKIVKTGASAITDEDCLDKKELRVEITQLSRRAAAEVVAFL